MSEKCLLDQWRDMAYDRNLPKDQLEKFWGIYRCNHFRSCYSLWTAAGHTTVER